MKTLIKGLFYFSLMAAATVHGGPTVTPYVNGLGGGMGTAYHPTNQHVYWVEADGDFKKVNTANGVVTTIQTGLVHPNDLALYPGQSLAYITTRVGELWKAATGSNTRTLVTSGLGIPGEIVLDPSAFVAYTVDYASGTLWQVNLAGGAKTAMVTGLSSPRGLVMTADFKTAYVSVSDAVVQVNLQTQQITTVVGSLGNAWYMDWAADDKSAIYIAVRFPGNRLLRLDLGTQTVQAITPLPENPSSVVRSLNPDVLYAASKTVLSKIQLSGGAGGPIVTRLGFIPSTEIDSLTGQATTDPAYFFYVKNASFGGSVHVMLNFPGMLGAGAAYYRVTVDGATDIATWTNYKWNFFTFTLQPVAPSNGYYKIPSAGEIWAIPDLGFVLDTAKFSNSKHTLRVALYDSSYNYLGLYQDVPFLVDNLPPSMDILEVKHDGQVLDECQLIVSGSPTIDITFKAHDAEGHLYNYGLQDNWGSAKSAPITSDQYIGVHDGSPTWSGVNPQTVTYTFSNTACAHSLTLGGWANTTNGYGFIHYSSDNEHIAIYLGGALCQ